MDSSVSRTLFGRLPSGEEVDAFTLTNRAGGEVRVCTYGAAVLSVRVPDRDGRPGDVVLGFERLEDYVADDLYVGVVVGRYANRIRGGRFELDGVVYRLPVNGGPNHLHGGPGGLQKVLWRPVEAETGGAAVTLRCLSPHGDQGYPGNLEVRVTYRLTDANELEVHYRGVTDAPTVLNLTQHSYFNLTGAPSSSIARHRVQIEADAFTPTDETLIPTGEIRDVCGTVLDFRSPVRLGERLDIGDPLLSSRGGFDHNFVLRGADGSLRPAARVTEPVTGRTLEVLTTEPGLQLYTGDYLHDAVGKGGAPYPPRAGLCLEPQHFPDSPNRPSFPSTVLRPGETYRSQTVYRFGTDRG